MKAYRSECSGPQFFQALMQVFLLQLETRHVLSLHLRGRLLTNSSNGSGALLRGVTRFHNSVTGINSSSLQVQKAKCGFKDLLDKVQI